MWPTAKNRQLSGVRLILTAALLVWLPALASSPAQADAPQALGVIALAVPEPLTCRHGICRTVLSSFCLEEHRRAPLEGTPYRPAPDTQITLVLTMQDGSQMAVPAHEMAEVRSARHYTSLEISLPESRLEAAGAIAAAVSVGPQATVLPVPTFRMGEPHTAQEIALLSGPIRKAAGIYFDLPGSAGTTARLLAALIGRAPAVGRADDSLREPPGNPMRDGAGPGRDAAPSANMQRVDTILRECAGMVEQGALASEATCLTWHHREIQIRSNEEFWDSLNGS